MNKRKVTVNPVIKDDVQRYRKNKLASLLAILGLVMCCAYFAVLYAQVNNNNYYYKWPIALDVIYNLFFLLFAFLFSEQVKNYNRRLFWLQMVLGVMQIVRIFWLPLAGVTETAYPALADVEFTGRVLSPATFVFLVVFLAASGACIIASGIIGFIRAKSLENFNKKLESGEISVDAVLKELDEADEKAADIPAPAPVEEVTDA